MAKWEPTDPFVGTGTAVADEEWQPSDPVVSAPPPRESPAEAEKRAVDALKRATDQNISLDDAHRQLRIEEVEQTAKGFDWTMFFKSALAGAPTVVRATGTAAVIYGETEPPAYTKMPEYDPRLAEVPSGQVKTPTAWERLKGKVTSIHKETGEELHLHADRGLDGKGELRARYYAYKPEGTYKKPGTQEFLQVLAWGWDEGLSQYARAAGHAARFTGQKAEAIVPESWRSDVQTAMAGPLFEWSPAAANAWMANIGYQAPVLAEMWGAQALTGPGGGYISMTLLEAGTFYDGGQAVGLDDDIAKKYAKIYGPTSGAIEYAQNLWMLKAFGGRAAKPLTGAAKSHVMRILKEVGGIVWEGAEELSQTTLENYLLQKAVAEHNERHPDQPPLVAPTLGEGGLHAFVIGAATAGVYRGAGHITSYAKARVAGQEAEAAKPSAEAAPAVAPAAPEETGERGVEAAPTGPQAKRELPAPPPPAVTEGRGLPTTPDVLEPAPAEAPPEAPVVGAEAEVAPEAKPGALPEAVEAAPAAVTRAKQLGVDLVAVKGSGKNGRILTKDVVAAAEAKAPTAEMSAKALRSRIHAVAADKGFPKVQLREIAKEHGGAASTKKMGIEQLRKVLAAVERTRPRRVEGKRVVTRKTEGKIQSLKARLTEEGRMTNEAFTAILKDLHIRTPGYVSAEDFITEKRGRELLHRMLDDAVLIEREESVRRAMEKPHASAPPDISSVWGRMRDAITSKLANRLRKGKPAKVSPLWDMRYYGMRWEERTGKPFHSAVQAVMEAKSRIQAKTEAAHRKIEAAEGGIPYRRIVKDAEAAKRIEQYLASQLDERYNPPAAPTDITADELKVAKAIQEIFRDMESVARLARFYDIYYHQVEKPGNLTKAEWRKAVDTYESQGPTALEEHLKSETWGIISRGYTPLAVVTGKVRAYQLGPTAFGKGHIKTRSGLYSPQEKNIFQRLNSYLNQIYGLTELRLPVRAFTRVFDEASDMMADPVRAGDYFSQWLDEVKGYPPRKHALDEATKRTYAQAMAVVILADPYKAVRNLGQNLAFYPDKTDFIDPRNKGLSDEDVDYFYREVDQGFGLMQDYFLASEEPLPIPILSSLTKLARRVPLYPMSDRWNRLACFWAKINRVRRALAKHPNDTQKMLSAASVLDLEPLQQRTALEVLARDGRDAMARYVSREVTFNIHFAYARYLRASAEHGSMGRVIGNLLTFPRSWGQQIYLSAKQAVYGKTFREKHRGLKRFVGLTAGAMLVGQLMLWLTGKRRNPYDPFNVISWTPGGLALGAMETGLELIPDIFRAVVWRDSDAMGRLTTSIPRAGSVFFPFYTQTLNAVEGLTGTVNIDRLAMRQIRALVDKEYGGPRARDYQAERNLIEAIQHIMFGGADKPEEETGRKTRGRSERQRSR